MRPSPSRTTPSTRPAPEAARGRRLITLKDGAGSGATPRDIAKNPKNLQFKEVEAAQTARSLDDVDAAVINGNFALPVGIKPAKDALILESAKNSRYGNFLAVKEGNEKDPRVKKLAKLLTSPEVKKFIEDKYQARSSRPSEPAPPPESVPPYRPISPRTGSASSQGVDPVVRFGAFMLHAGQFSSP